MCTLVTLKQGKYEITFTVCHNSYFPQVDPGTLCYNRPCLHPTINFQLIIWHCMIITVEKGCH